MDVAEMTASTFIPPILGGHGRENMLVSTDVSSYLYIVDLCYSRSTVTVIRGEGVQGGDEGTEEDEVKHVQRGVTTHPT